MKRKIVNINEEKCNGCGACADACHEGAIKIVNGKAKLIRDDYCDGLGDCLPSCLVGAIEIIEKETVAYNEEEVKKHLSQFSCPGSLSKTIERKNAETKKIRDVESALSNWPVQIKLAPFSAPYFENSRLLIAADCTAYAYASFHEDFINGRTTLIGCPKLDAIDYSEKLEEIIRRNNIEEITVLRMEVPCCKGLEYAVKNAIERIGKALPLNVVTISIDGKILN